MAKKLIYIMSDNRSGSTLLDQLLGGNPSIMSLGEVHHLTAYALDDRGIYDPVHPLVCSCGQFSWMFWGAQFITQNLSCWKDRRFDGCS